MYPEENNFTLHTIRHGDGKPLVFLPGWGMSARATAYWMEPLFRHADGWQRVYVDPPGHGGTPAPTWITSQDDILTVLLEFIGQQFIGRRFVLGGYSNGAYLARGLLYHWAEWVDGLLMLAPTVEPERAAFTAAAHRGLPGPDPAAGRSGNAGRTERPHPGDAGLRPQFPPPHR